MASKCETEEVLREELAHYDVQYKFGRGGRHPCVRIERGGRTCKVFYSKTYTGSRGPLNARADLRAKLRELGAVKKGGSSGVVG